MYRYMLTVRRFNERMLLLQRQGRIGFFIESTGQEACQIGSAMPLTQGDWVYGGYRDPGICLVRGVPLKALVDQLMGERGRPEQGQADGGPLGLQGVEHREPVQPRGCRLSQAVGTAYAAKFKKDNIVCLTSFGDGATSQGEFHSAMNFAGVFKVPVIFFCENNQYAISLPVRRQTASENIAIKAEAYGFEGVLVDGNDVLAVYKATKAAVDKARSGGGPTLIEAVTYRMGGHSSSDDPSKYRSIRGAGALEDQRPDQAVQGLPDEEGAADRAGGQEGAGRGRRRAGRSRSRRARRSRTRPASRCSRMSTPRCRGTSRRRPTSSSGRGD